MPPRRDFTWTGEASEPWLYAPPVDDSVENGVARKQFWQGEEFEVMITANHQLLDDSYELRGKTVEHEDFECIDVP